jgi:hypothetical protein
MKLTVWRQISSNRRLKYPNGESCKINIDNHPAL